MSENTKVNCGKKAIFILCLSKKVFIFGRYNARNEKNADNNHT